jgi:hypothetical protein
VFAGLRDSGGSKMPTKLETWLELENQLRELGEKIKGIPKSSCFQIQALMRKHWNLKADVNVAREEFFKEKGL